MQIFLIWNFYGRTKSFSQLLIQKYFQQEARAQYINKPAKSFIFKWTIMIAVAVNRDHVILSKWNCYDSIMDSNYIGGPRFLYFHHCTYQKIILFILWNFSLYKKPWFELEVRHESSRGPSRVIIWWVTMES